MKWFKNRFKQLGQIIWKKKEVFPKEYVTATKPKSILGRVKSWFKPKPVRAELPKEKPIVDRSETQQKILDAIRSSKATIKQEVPKPILPPPTKPDVFIDKATTPQTPVKQARQPEKRSVYEPKKSPIHSATPEIRKLRNRAIDRGLEVQKYATMDKDELIYELTGREISELRDELEELHTRKQQAGENEKADIEEMEAILEQKKRELEEREAILETLDRDQLEKLVLEEKITQDDIDDAADEKPGIDGEDEEFGDETT